MSAIQAVSPFKLDFQATMVEEELLRKRFA